MSAEHAPGTSPRELRLVEAMPDDAVEAWLGLLVRLLDVPASEAEAIREELESHLRERVRDLVVSGQDEEDAVRCAVSELGDAAALASRYREVRAYPRRRLMMNLSVLGLIGGVVAVGLVAVTQPGASVPVSVFEPPAPTQAEQAAMSRQVSAKRSSTTLDDALSFIAESSGLALHAEWRALDEAGVNPETPVTLGGGEVTISAMIRLISEQIGGPAEDRLDVRVNDGTLRVATVTWFDQRETVLACYDLSGLASDVSADAVPEVIQKFVFPDGWLDNGGTTAKLHMVGNRMFVEAPTRYQARVEWFVEQLRTEGAGVMAGAAPGGAREPRLSAGPGRGR